MWPEILLTSVSALATGALAVPAARKLMLGKEEHHWLANELEFDCIEPDGSTVRLKDETFFRVFKIRGVSYDAKIMNQQEQMLKGRERLLHALGSANVRLSFFGVKRLNDISFEAEWPSLALSEIGDAERTEFQSSYFIDWFLLISGTSMQVMIDASFKITTMLETYQPRLLRRPDDKTEPCQLTGFINYLICGDLRKDLLAVSENISGNLARSPFATEKVTGLIQTKTPEQHFHQIIAVHGWSDSVSGRLFVEIMALPGDIEISQLCDPISRNTATLMYTRRKKDQALPVIGNKTAGDECAAILELLSQGNTTLFHTQTQIILRAKTAQNLEDNVSYVAKVLDNFHISHSVETMTAPNFWFDRIPKGKRSKIPGATDLFLPLIVQEQNIAALWSFNHSPTGLLKSPYGDRPVRFFRTPSGQAYSFQFHASNTKQALGNYLVFAPAGSGKSTLIMHLLGGLAKFDNVRSYIFDSKEGARFMVEAMGGLYQGYEDLHLNPLDVGEDTLANRHRVYSVLKAMAANVTLDHDDEAALVHAVEIAFKMAPPDRTLNSIYEFAFARRTKLRRAFSRWVIDGKGRAGMDAHVFNAPHDSLGSLLGSSHLVGINMNEALGDPVLGPPVVAHISEAIYKSAASNTQGFNIFIDEAAKLLQNDGFSDLAAEMYREYRKLNGSVGMAFQDPAALFRSPHADAFLENTATLFFFPNSLASKESLEPFNLNDEQIGFILGGQDHERKAGARQVLVVKRDAAKGFDESAILDVDLSSLGDCLRFYRAGVDANKHLFSLKTKWGDQWQSHL